MRISEWHWYLFSTLLADLLSNSQIKPNSTRMPRHALMGKNTHVTTCKPCSSDILYYNCVEGFCIECARIRRNGIVGVLRKPWHVTPINRNENVSRLVDADDKMSKLIRIYIFILSLQWKRKKTLLNATDANKEHRDELEWEMWEHIRFICHLFDWTEKIGLLHMKCATSRQWPKTAYQGKPLLIAKRECGFICASSMTIAMMCNKSVS